MNTRQKNEENMDLESIIKNEKLINSRITGMNKNKNYSNNMLKTIKHKWFIVISEILNKVIWKKEIAGRELQE